MAKKGLTQQKVANFVGVDIKTFGAWERGDFDVKVKYLPKISEILDIPITDLHDEAKWVSRPYTRADNDKLDNYLHEESPKYNELLNSDFKKEIEQLKEQNLALTRAYNELYEKNINQSKKKVTV